MECVSLSSFRVENLKLKSNSRIGWTFNILKFFLINDNHAKYFFLFFYRFNGISGKT